MNDDYQHITLSCRVDTYRSGWTVLDFLLHRFTYHARGRWVERIDDGRVRVNDSKTNAERVVCEGDTISYTFFHNEPTVDASYDIVYEDDGLLVVSKSGNLPVHASGLYICNTLIALLKNRYGDHLNLAHRLDRETSGLVVLSKDKNSARRLAELFFNGKVKKSYFAVVHGRVETSEFEVDAPIGKKVTPQRSDTFEKDDSDLAVDLPRHVMRRYIDTKNGKPARTRFRTLRYGKGYTALHAEPLSGRTNQIRVHLHHIGHPIIGDKVYGDTALDGGLPSITRQALHCHTLEFAHPMSGKPLRVEAPLARDLRAFANSLYDSDS